MNPNFLILYVRDVPASAAFYAQLLDRAPAESSAGFALFVLESGLRLGLWARAGVLPAPGPSGDAAEIAFALPDDAAVDATHAAWARRSLVILQSPVRMDFGYTFVALDPDGHRLRVFSAAR